jgi:hypothetical protein
MDVSDWLYPSRDGCTTGNINLKIAIYVIQERYVVKSLP